ncbi:MAG: Hsp20/alpha crystallin family protein [Myxococcota bacterium]
MRRELAALEEQLDHVFERAFGGGVRMPTQADSYRPAIDVYETEDALVVEMELPTVSPEDVTLTLDGEYLQIAGVRRARRAGRALRHLRKEIPQGAFERVLRFKVNYDPDLVSASLEAGLLRVTLPRVLVPRVRIPVEGVGEE